MDNLVTKINNVSETLFLTLYSRAIESQKNNPIIKDNKSIEIVKNLDKFFLHSEKKLHKRLLNRNIPEEYSTFIAVRTKKFDSYVKDFLTKNPNATVVELGCGLSTRFQRVDNGKIIWYDLDLPSVIELKKQFLKENNRYKLISSSLHDFDWIHAVSTGKKSPIIFIAEGVFQYLHEKDIRSLVLNLQKKFPGCELVCSVVNSKIKNKQNKKILKNHSKNILNIDKNVTINFGISKSNEMSNWNEGIEFIDETRLFDSNFKRIKFSLFYLLFEKIRKSELIVHYKLN